MINLILCGGFGTRLWPLSRKLMPKQFLPLFSGKSLFQLTVERNRKCCNDFWIASNKDQLFLAFEQLGELGIKFYHGVAEPVSRNTAPAIALTCFSLDPQEVVLVTPSDHVLTNELEYSKALKLGERLAREGQLVTLGLRPTYPATGFGYIESDGNRVLSFKEKPNLQLATEFLSNPKFLWNSGIFIFQAGNFLKELRDLAPDVFNSCKLAWESSSSKTSLTPSLIEMSKVPDISIDYAVLEKSKKVAVVPCELGWSDLGSFDALEESLKKADEKNTVVSIESPIFLDSEKNLVISGTRKVALIGVENLLVIESDDSVLIARKGKSQLVKDVVSEIKKVTPELLNSSLFVRKPWGSYTILRDEPHFKVKKLEVIPGKRLSLQKHAHRQEHWVVAKGDAKVQVGSKIENLTRNQYIYIPLGEIHRLENAGTEVLEVIETQIGDYFGEDDIVRIEDDYARANE